ncbi:MAG: ester cyclase [Trueperaceae bacterium]|nr:MAG: ester cyclase [Trueperaceae bacterium]
MSLENNKAVARQFYRILETGDISMADEIVAADYVNHNAIPGQKAGLEGYKDVVRSLRTSLPDIRYTIEDQVAEGDKVVTRYTAKGTHQGEFLGVAATGKPITMTALVLQRVVDGKIQESWLELDMLSVLRQMGEIPSPG